MNQASVNQVTKAERKTDVSELVARPVMLPGEKEADYDALHVGLMRELAPATPYECAIACNIVNLEWDAARERRLRDQLLTANYIRMASNILRRGTPEHLPARTTRDLDDIDAARLKAAALTGGDDAARLAVEAELAQRGFSAAEVLALAHGECILAMDVHQARIADIEARRRRLREDYYKLKATPSGTSGGKRAA